MKFLFFIYLFLIGIQSFAYTGVVKSDETNAQVKQKLVTLFKEGGTLTIEEGTWTINMTSSEATLKNDIAIIDANINKGVFKPGAFEICNPII